jgi:hypothetical protein
MAKVNSTIFFIVKFLLGEKYLAERYPIKKRDVKLTLPGFSCLLMLVQQENEYRIISLCFAE